MMGRRKVDMNPDMREMIRRDDEMMKRKVMERLGITKKTPDARYLEKEEPRAIKNWLAGKLREASKGGIAGYSGAQDETAIFFKKKASGKTMIVFENAIGHPSRVAVDDDHYYEGGERVKKAGSVIFKEDLTKWRFLDPSLYVKLLSIDDDEIKVFVERDTYTVTVDGKTFVEFIEEEINEVHALLVNESTGSNITVAFSFDRSGGLDVMSFLDGKAMLTLVIDHDLF